MIHYMTDLCASHEVLYLMWLRTHVTIAAVIKSKDLGDGCTEAKNADSFSENVRSGQPEINDPHFIIAILVGDAETMVMWL